jgi:hypothetical protein
MARAKGLLISLIMAVLILLICVSATYLFRPLSAKMVCDSLVDLGLRRAGEECTIPFTIRNAGGKTLHIHSIRSDCSCTGLEYESSSGRFVRAEEIRVPPGEKAVYRIRYVVRSFPGQLVRSTIRFATNDPAQPTATVEIVVPQLVGIRLEPNFLHITKGTVGAGKTVDLWNIGNTSPRLVSVRASHSDVSVSLRQKTGEELSTTQFSQPSDQRMAGTYLGTVEVDDSHVHGNLEFNVQVQVKHERESEFVTIPCQVIETPSVVVSPRLLRLPRSTSEGIAFSGRFFCQFQNEIQGPLALKCPENITARVVQASERSALVEVEAEPRVTKGKHTILLQNRDASVSVPLMVDIEPQEVVK